MRKFTLKLIVFIHALWTFLVVASLPFAFLYPQYHKELLVFIGVTLIFQLPLQMCPFTYLENKLRGHAESYQGTFLHHYLKLLFGVEASEKVLSTAILLYLLAIILVAVFYRMDVGFQCYGGPIY